MCLYHVYGEIETGIANSTCAFSGTVYLQQSEALRIETTTADKLKIIFVQNLCYDVELFSDLNKGLYFFTVGLYLLYFKRRACD